MNRSAFYVLGGIIAVLVLVAIVVSGRGDDDEVADRPTGTTSPPVTVDPSLESCLNDLSGILEAATAPGSTYDSAYNDVVTIYGFQDERTRFLTLTLRQFRVDTFQVGVSEASANVYSAVDGWCVDNAERVGY